MVLVSGELGGNKHHSRCGMGLLLVIEVVAKI
jgi:hypothetical protein